MSPDELKSWRKGERVRLIAAREGIDAATLERFRQRLDRHLWRSFPGLATSKLAFYWPIRGEYDARPLTQKLREHGAVTALPVVVGARQPLVFREWQPGVALASGPLGISYPVGSDPVVPTAMLVPMLGWDEAGYRLGYMSRLPTTFASSVLDLSSSCTLHSRSEPNGAARRKWYRSVSNP